MKEQMKFVRKLPEPIEVQQEIPLRAPYRKLKTERDQAIEDIMTGKPPRPPKDWTSTPRAGGSGPASGGGAVSTDGAPATAA